MDFIIVSEQRSQEESKFQEIIDFPWQTHQFGEIDYLDTFINDYPLVDRETADRLDLNSVYQYSLQKAKQPHSKGTLIGLALDMKSRISQFGEDALKQQSNQVYESGIKDYLCILGPPGTTKNKEQQNYYRDEPSKEQRQLDFLQKITYQMIILKTALLFTILTLIVLSNAQEAKTYGCANQRIVKMIGDDPMPFKTAERFVEFPFGVKFSHKIIKEVMDSMLKGKDYFGPKSTHFSANVNGIFVFVVEAPQVTLFQAIMKTPLKRTTATQVVLPEALYLKTVVHAEQPYAIHQITLGKIKRELFNEEKQTVNSFTGVQFQKRIVNIIFATPENGKPTDFTADDDFLNKVSGIVKEIEGGKKCEQFICDPPSLQSIAEATQDLAVIKIDCNKKSCTYTSKQKQKDLFVKIPFLQAGKVFRYLDKPQNGMLVAVIEVDNQPFVSITAQLGLRCNVKDFDYHEGPYSAAIQSVNFGEQKLYSVIVIEPGYNGIKRSLRLQTPEMYDMLEGIQKVKMIYYFMIISNKSPDTIFSDFAKAIENAKIADSKKYTCTLLKSDSSKSFLQIASSFSTKKLKQPKQPKYQYDYDYDQEEEDQEYMYMYDYDYDVQEEQEEQEEEQEYDDIPAEEEQQEQTAEEQSEETDEGQSEETAEETLKVPIEQEQQPQMQVLAEKQEMCFTAYGECNYQGPSLKICGPEPTIPRELQNFYIRSMQIPDEMKITFFTSQKKKIQLQGDQTCLHRPFEVGVLSPRKQNEQIQLAHQG